MNKYIVLVAAITLLIQGCGKTSAEEMNYGSFENGRYSNNYLNMSIELPRDWVIQSEAQNEQILDAGTDLLANDDKNLRRILTESQKQSVILFSIFKFEQGAPVSSNPSIVSVAENVESSPGIRRGSDYNFHVKQILSQGQLDYSFQDSEYSEVLSGVEFDVLPADLRIGPALVHQDYYAARLDDYVLSFILTYVTDSESQELSEILSGLKIK